MPSNFELFKKQLDEAVELIDESVLMDETNYPAILDEALDTQSLLDRCETICQKHEPKKPVIRIIHHLACSGGTLISKCISAMPNVYLLSEVHPFTDLGGGKDKAKYSPTDIISLIKYADVPFQYELAKRIFNISIDEVYQHVLSVGGILVLRDHTHSDFSTDKPIPSKSILVSLLEERYEVKSVLTIRDPIDSYSSLIKNRWVHFSPRNFEEYCRRVCLLVDAFEETGIFKYEDFVKSPESVMIKICDSLDIPFNDEFKYIFSAFKVTGDSGRTSNVIGERISQVDSDLIKEANVSSYYKTLHKYINR